MIYADYDYYANEYFGRASKKKTFVGYIDEIWQEAIKDSDKGVKTGKKPVKREKAE